MKSINIGLIGFGTVGSGLYRLLEKNSGLIRERTGLTIKISAVCDLDTDNVKKHTSGVTITGNWKDIVNDDSIDIVAELIGGIEPAKSITLEAMAMGKSVVTANKKLLAEEGRQIFETAAAGKAAIGFEAAVAGGIPCILSLRNGLVGNRIRTVLGILNGTTNYILSQMEDHGLPFADVLKDAQEKGFAEADPTFDIEGFDAGHKIALLAMLAYGKRVDYTKIPIEGITKITDLDISLARDMGYAIKLLGIAREVDGKLDIGVHPTMIPAKHPLAAVRDEYNSVMFDGDMTDPVVLNGKGAGSFPTASAVLSDIVQIASSGCEALLPIKADEDAAFMEPGERMSRYYIRMHTDDNPGILSKISGVLGSHDISISSVIQKEAGTGPVPLIFMTHRSLEGGIMAALEEIRKFSFVHGDGMLVRVEDSHESGADNE